MRRIGKGQYAGEGEPPTVPPYPERRPTQHYFADWINDDGMPHSGIYCVRETANERVLCTTNPLKAGWEKALTIARAMNELVEREGRNTGIPTNV